MNLEEIFALLDAMPIGASKSALLAELLSFIHVDSEFGRVNAPLGRAA
jgi:hypothetical protein